MCELFFECAAGTVWNRLTGRNLEDNSALRQRPSRMGGSRRNSRSPLLRGRVCGDERDLWKEPLVSARPEFVRWKRLGALAGGHRPKRVAMSPVSPPATTVGELWDLRHVTHDRIVA